VAAAFSGAHVASLGADSADIRHKSRAAARQAGCRPANAGAVDRQADAFRQRFGVVFFEAGGRAVLARLGTIHTRINTRSMFFASHRLIPF
jgi:hypothetical protein